MLYIYPNSKCACWLYQAISPMIYTIDFVIFCICRSIESNLPSPPRGFVACNIYIYIPGKTYRYTSPYISHNISHHYSNSSIHLYIYMYTYICIYIYIFANVHIYILSTMKNKLICCCFFKPPSCPHFFKLFFQVHILRNWTKTWTS